MAKAATKTLAYDASKRYGVTMARVVEHEGFVYKPGANPIEMTGDLANALAADIAEAKELAAAADHPKAPPSVHEAAT